MSLAQKSFGANTTPSQIVPDVLDEIEKREIENQKNRQILPEIRELDSLKQLDDPIKAKINSLIIIAPKELQTAIDFNKYKEQIVGKELSINELNQFTKIIGAEYIEKGYPLVRVTLPPQKLKPDGATLFLKVIDGFIEKIDLSTVPENQRKVTFSFLKELVKKKQLQQSFLERKLLLAGNINGLSLTSAFSPGSDEGGTILTIDAKHKYVSGSIQFNNTQSEELARQLGILSLSSNSALGLGENLTLFGIARPTLKGMKGTKDDVSIRGGGFSLSSIIGNDGLKASLSYTETMTRPGGDVRSLSLESNMKSGNFTLSYPLLLSARNAWSIRGSLGWIDEIQQTNSTGIDQEISHDRLTSIRGGLTYFGCGFGCLTFDSQISRGLEIASRSASEATTGTPLSRTSGTSTYTHFRLNSSYSFVPFEKYSLKFIAGGQYTDDGLLNSEQTTIVGLDRISSLTSGAISGDKVWFLRSELTRSFNITKQINLSPYLYSAMGVAYLNKPTEAENKETAAKSIGGGIIFNNFNNILSFDKNISAKLEYSKTIATDKIEELSDVRLNKQHLLLILSMYF